MNDYKIIYTAIQASKGSDASIQSPVITRGTGEVNCILEVLRNQNILFTINPSISLADIYSEFSDAIAVNSNDPLYQYSIPIFDDNELIGGFGFNVKKIDELGSSTDNSNLKIKN
jgi:hypothetical protein